MERLLQRSCRTTEVYSGRELLQIEGGGRRSIELTAAHAAPVRARGTGQR